MERAHALDDLDACPWRAISSRGHVLTHPARNADGGRRLLIRARTGAQTPEYPSPAARSTG
ncbi:hypothetical protein LRD69_01875 [Streptomyces sp. JH14]|uniref:hypothetical protein n=1 Tax=Streptomyces sp. JH14 TaxID=2793630 RepID=UPI0023F92CDC|nr:hypothetical protein [Streptomyces sp. JH14]MDF6040936.1 hypothetical protein [Streptomyces sp. JH14]